MTQLTPNGFVYTDHEDYGDETGYFVLDNVDDRNMKCKCCFCGLSMYGRYQELTEEYPSGDIMCRGGCDEETDDEEETDEETDEKEEKEIEKKKFVDGWVEFNKGVINKIPMCEILEGFEPYWEKKQKKKVQKRKKKPALNKDKLLIKTSTGEHITYHEWVN